jgi:hypothetical protein
MPEEITEEAVDEVTENIQVEEVTEEEVAVEEEVVRIQRQMEDEKAAKEAEKKEADWDAIYEWAFGYTKDSTPENRMAERFKGKHGKYIKGNRGQMETQVFELYKETL